MKKSILNLEGTRNLSTEELKKINGGRVPLCCLDWDPIKKVCYNYDPNCNPNPNCNNCNY